MAGLSEACSSPKTALFPSANALSTQRLILGTIVPSSSAIYREYTIFHFNIVIIIEGGATRTNLRIVDGIEIFPLFDQPYSGQLPTRRFDDPVGQFHRFLLSPVFMRSMTVYICAARNSKKSCRLGGIYSGQPYSGKI